MRLYEKILTLRLGDGTDICNHVHDMARNRTQLRAVGVEIEDPFNKLAVLRSLSSTFDCLAVALEAQIDSLPVEDLNARIFREASRQLKTVDTDAKALRGQHRCGGVRQMD